MAESTTGLLDRILARGLLKTERDLAEVWEARLVLETELAAMAAERAEEEDLDSLRDLLAQSERSLAGEGRAFIELDLEFHLGVARCARNKVLRHLMTDIRGVLIEWITKSQELPGMRENALEQHTRIFESIRQRNPEQAREAMREHLATFQGAYRLLGKIAGGHVLQM